MDMRIILWTCGMLFSVGIFAAKVGLGLGFGRASRKIVILTFSTYGALFVAVAALSERLTALLQPLLRKGPFLHVLLACGMLAWGVVTLNSSCKPEGEDLTQHSGRLLTPSMMLIIPCPVCMTAMAFSTWAALSVIKLPAFAVGLMLGLVFASMGLIFYAFTRLRRTESPETGLGLVMMAIGLYFIASLFIPAKIEQAKGVYASFVPGGSAGIDPNNTRAVLAALFAAMLAGYILHNKGAIRQ
jgi:predicted transporter